MEVTSSLLHGGGARWAGGLDLAMLGPEEASRQHLGHLVSGSLSPRASGWF